MPPTAHPHKVYIIDDDESVRRALCRVLRSAGMVVHAYASVDEFVAECVYTENACVIADVRMPGIGGLGLPRTLHRIGCDLPVIIVTAQDSDAARAEAKRAGVVAFFHKPVDDQALLDAVEWSIQDEGRLPGSGRVPG